MDSVALIYARSENYCIGLDGDLPWHLPEEFQHFNDTTTGAATIMGRKTYEDHSSALPNRLNIVITRRKNYPLAEGVLRTDSLPGALALAGNSCERIFVIGGATLLRDALPLADTVYETVVHAQVKGDTFVDAFDFGEWHSELLAHHSVDNNHCHAFSIYRHRRQ